jgi:YjbE family integral membrane protein
MLDELNGARFWFDLLQIVGINILLSGDNAVVIALASRSLPESQRKMAVIGGSGAAVVLRIALCLIVASLLQVRYLKLIGGLLLLYIGVKLLVDEESNDEIAARPNMWGAIRTILIADAVMSLDNVVAIAAAAHDSVLLITLGLLISIPLIVFGSQLMLKILARYPVLVTLGGGLLGWIAGEIIVSDPVVHNYLPFNEHLVAQIAKPVLALMVMAAGLLISRRAAES